MEAVRISRSKTPLSPFSTFPLVPRTPRRKISFLNTSFRRPLKETSSQPQRQSNSRDGHHRSSSPARDTDKHLSSILDHPLFRVTPSRTPRPETSHPSSSESVIGTQEIMRDPLRTLDELMARGQADCDTLYKCLTSYLNQSKSINRRDSLKSCGGSSKIVSWYAAADQESRRHFFSSRRMMAAVMPYLVVEGFETTAITWLHQLHRHGSDIQADRGTEHFADLSREGQFFNVLYEFVSSQRRYTGIQSAVKSYIRCCNTFAPGRTTERPQFKTPLRATGVYLIAKIVSNAHSPQAKTFDTTLFDEFHTTFKSLVDTKSYWITRLQLHHPVTPNIDQAVQYLKPRLNEPISNPANANQRLLNLSLETADLCIKKKRFGEASWLITKSKALFAPDSRGVDSSIERLNRQSSSTSDLLSQLCPQ